MDHELHVIDGQNLPLVLLAFLRAECQDGEYDAEVKALESNLSPGCNGLINCDAGGDIECDGHMSLGSITLDFDDIQPEINLNGIVNDARAAVVQQVAADLRVIAARFEHNMVARATQNLQRGIHSSPKKRWTEHLSREVESALQQGVCLQDLPRERVIMAFGLTVVRGVCEQTPHMLRSMFEVALQFMRNSGRR